MDCELLKFNCDQVTAGSTLALAILTIFIAIYAYKAHRANKKALYANTVSNSRPPYIGTLRSAFSDLYTALLNQNKKAIIRGISNAMYHFNQYESVGIDDAFISNCLNQLLRKARNNEDISDEDIRKYRTWSAGILQYEWQCFKDECIYGRKLTMDEKKKNKTELIDDKLVGL